MSIIIHKHFGHCGNIAESFGAAKSPATASDLAFARQSTNQNFWWRARALVQRAWGPLVIYSDLAIALVAAIAIRVAAWVPQVWR